MKTLIAAVAVACGLLAGTVHAAPADCEAKATEKKLAGAARTSFVKKCIADAGGHDAQAMCEKSAADKKLAGAAKASHIKKCVADAAAGRS